MIFCFNMIVGTEAASEILFSTKNQTMEKFKTYATYRLRGKPKESNKHWHTFNRRIGLPL